MKKVKLFKVIKHSDRDDKLVSIEVSPNKKDDFVNNGWDTITKDNIALYYEFMSDEDLEKYKDIIADIFDKRISDISKKFDKNKSIIDFVFMSGIPGLNSEPKHIQRLNHTFGNWILKFSLFGIKDTLKPIDEYIAEIKESEAYRAYMAEKS